MSGDRRRSPRMEVDLALEVRPVGRDLRLSLRAVDVNEHGVFVATTEPLALHTAVQIRLMLSARETLDFTGRVVRILWPDRVEPGEPPGFGVQFDPPEAAEAERWSAFCRDMVERHARAPERRFYTRVPTRCELHVRAASEASMKAFVAHNLSAGGAGFMTNAEMPIGMRLSLALHHPTTDEIFRLGGEVVRCEAMPRASAANVASEPTADSGIPPTDAPPTYLVGVRFNAPQLQAFTRLTAALPD